MIFFDASPMLFFTVPSKEANEAAAERVTELQPPGDGSIVP